MRVESHYHKQHFTHLTHCLQSSFCNPSTNMAEQININVSLTPIDILRFYRSGNGEEVVFNDGEVYTSIADMTQESFTSNTNHILLAEVLYIRKKKDDRENSFKSKGAGEKNLSFDSSIMCRCLNSPNGVNIFSILLGPQRNNHLFNRNIEARYALSCVFLMCSY